VRTLPLRGSLAALLSVGLLAACGGADTAQPSGTADAASPAEGPVVVSTVAPVVDLVRQVMGERGELRALVPPGVNSHTFEPSPGDAQMLVDADLFIANGLFLEEPSLQLAEANLPQDAATVTLAEQAISRDEWAFDFSYPADDGVPNPHLWTSVALSMDYVEQIADALAEVDPDGADTYAANAEAYLAELDALDGAVAEAIASIPAEDRRLITYHDSWPYFGSRYDIEVVGAVQPADFAEPSAAEVRTIIDQVRSADVPAIFGSEEFPSDVLRVISDETGAAYIEDLTDDELPGEPGDPDHSYIGMMVRNVRIMVDNLGGDATVLDAVDPARG
jgi:ABC-type Zn uptake system ZnuABC Zn-binding protein ZnuA